MLSLDTTQQVIFRFKPFKKIIMNHEFQKEKYDSIHNFYHQLVYHIQKKDMT